MAASVPKSTNPFYVVLVAVGILFLLTAMSYLVMTLQGRQTGLSFDEPQPAHPFVAWMEQYGFTALMIELGVLAVATIAAIGTDEYWTNRAAAFTGRESTQPHEPSAAEDNTSNDQP